jgi:D-arginine dehydrogenase
LRDCCSTPPVGELVAPIVINAAGAWADVIAERIGAKTVGLQPTRRTAIAFVPQNAPVDNDWPVVIDTDEDWYFKVDAGTVLGSLADETPVDPHDAQPEELDIALRVDRLERGQPCRSTASNAPGLVSEALLPTE